MNTVTTSNAEEPRKWQLCSTLLSIPLAGLLAGTAIAGPAQLESTTIADVPLSIASLSILQSRPVDKAPGGVLFEIQRERREPVSTEGLQPPRSKGDADSPDPKAAEQSANDAGRLAEFEFFDVASQRSFIWQVERKTLRAISQSVAPGNERSVGKQTPPPLSEDEEAAATSRSWSNGTDGRTRRGIADGYADDNSVYQSLTDYGGCSATVLYASSTKMIAVTAAHCVYTSGGGFSSSKLRPRRDGTGGTGGSTSPTWGSWTPYNFGTYPQYLDNDCEDNWKSDVCIKYDIALVIASPDSGASPPSALGYAYQPKSVLNSYDKYRRGYPSCSYGYSPSGCTDDTLYGDGALSLKYFGKKDSDGWHRQVRHSSDTSPGDSGSGLYYVRSGNRYVFAVHSTGKSCGGLCSTSYANKARLFTEEWFDFTSTVIP